MPKETSPAKVTLDKALALQKAGRLQEARAMYEDVLRHEPCNADALYLTGLFANEVGNAAICEAMLRRALQAQPGFHPARLALAQLLESQKRYDEAEQEYETAIRATPYDPQLQHDYGKMLFDTGRYSQAADVFRRTVKKQPGLAGSWHMLGATLYTLGDFEGARRAFGETLKLSPDAGMTHWNLSNITTYREGNPHLAQMEAVMARPDLPPAEKTELHFALGKAYHDLKRYDVAFRHYQAGGRLQRMTYRYSVDSDRQEMAEIKQKFGALLPKTDLSLGCPDDTPVFILGMPRSGTTLVEQILSSHPDVAGAGEVPFLFDTLKRAGQTAAGQTVFRFSDLTPAGRSELGAEYVRMLRRHAPKSAKHVTDKTPGNFRIIGFIAMVLPHARIIHCTRNAMDTCLSVYRSHFSTILPYASDLEELGQYYRLYRELMDFWNAALPGRIFEVNYERLLGDFEPQVRRLLKHCGLGWNDKCLQFHETKRSVATASGVQVRSPLYRSSQGGWRHYEPWLGDLKGALGPYAPSD